MNIEQKLNEIVAALDELKIPHLVMGGHAVRYYGFHQRASRERDAAAAVSQASSGR